MRVQWCKRRRPLGRTHIPTKKVTCCLIREIVDEGDDASVSDSDDESDNGEYHDSESNRLEQIDSEDEFVDAEFEELVSSEGPQEMLRLMLQE